MCVLSLHQLNITAQLLQTPNSAELSCVPQMLTVLVEFDQFVVNVAGQTDSHSISLRPRVYCC